MNLSQTYPVQRVCEALGISRSSFYYQARQTDETALREALKKAAGQYVKYGSRRLSKELNRRGWPVGRQKVRGLMRELGIEVKAKKQKVKTTDSNHDSQTSRNLVKGLEIVHPDQVWVADITYIYIPIFRYPLFRVMEVAGGVEGCPIFVVAPTGALDNAILLYH